MKPRRTRLLLVAALVILGVRPALADPHPNTQGGVDVNQIFQVGNVDNVNLFNGALTVSIPLSVAYPVGGSFSYRLLLVANSNPWDLWDVQYTDPGTGKLSTANDSAPSHCSNAGLGWRVSLGAVAYGDEVQKGAANNYGLTPSSPVCAAAAISQPYAIYEGPDGAQHLFYATLHPNDPDDTLGGVADNVSTGVENVQYTRDGSYLRLTRYNAKTPSETTTIEFPDGTIHTFNATGHITQMRDRFNNQVNITYGTVAGGTCPGSVSPETSCWEIADTQSRAQWVYFRGDLPWYNGTGVYQPLVNRIVLTGFNATQNVYTFSYALSPSIGRGCPMSDVEYGDVQVPLLSGVLFPDGSQYQPTATGYLLQPAGAGNCVWGSGSLTQLTLPTQGSLSWTYQNYYFPSGSSIHSFRTTNPGVRTRNAYDGTASATWTYSTTATAGTTAAWVMNQVQDPLGNLWNRYFSLYAVIGSVPYGPGPNTYDYGQPYNPTVTESGNNPPNDSDLFLSEQVIDAAGVPRRTTWVRYERDWIQQGGVVYYGPTPPDISNNNNRLAQQNIVYDDGAQAGYLDQDFDGVGHYRYRQTSGTFAGNNVRLSRQQFNPVRLTYSSTQSTDTYTGNYVYLPPTTQWVLTTSQYQWQAENNVAEVRSFCYDADTGFLLRQRLYSAGPAPGASAYAAVSANDVLQVFAPNTQGELASEQYFGGDNSPVTPTSTDLCSQTIPSAHEYQINHGYAYGVENHRQYVGSGFFSLDRDIDASTGLVKTDRDTASISTTFGYDSLGRLTTIHPRDGAWTQNFYGIATPSTPASLTIQSQQNGAPGTVLAQTKFIYDGRGRPKEKDGLMADGTTSRQFTSYNGMGWKSSETEQGAPNAATYVTQYTGYDPFGRVGTVQPPDGAAHDVRTTYGGAQTVTRTVSLGTSWNGAAVTEAPATTTSVYDRFGRLASVTEPSGIGSANVTTSYSYDPGNRLSQVSTTAAGATQNRTITYDRRGFLVSESHPETASPKTYSSYDSRGHYHRMTDGVNDLSFNFDLAERPLTIWNTANGGNCAANPAVTATCLKQYRYDGTSDSLGRLYQASRFNHMSLSGTPYGDEWTYTYTYLGLDGRLSLRNLQHTFCSTASCQATAAQESFSQSWSYTQLGKIDTETYPSCAPAFGACSGVTGRSVPNLYTNGYLTGISGYTSGSGITYYPNGMVSSVTAFNGVTTAYGADPDGLPRPSSISASLPMQTLWNTGAYAYDGAGNVKQIGHGYATYDLVSRLTAAQVQTNSIDSTNPALNTFASQGFSYDPFGNLQQLGNTTPSTSSATNHLLAGSYDAAGNLRSWSGASYDFDELNNLKHYKNGAQEWLYIYDADDERVWSFQVGASPRFDRWTLRGLDGKVKRTFEVAGYNWSTGWTTGNSWEDYVYRDGLLLAGYPNNAQRRTMSVDHLGTPRLVTNGSGTQSAYHAYFPYGEEATPVSQDCATAPCERMKFTGHERDLSDPTSDQDDLDYMHARHYSLITGRLLSLDPVLDIKQVAKQPQQWNRYVYVVNNPLLHADPKGKCAEDLCVGEGAAAAAALAYLESPEGQVAVEKAEGELVSLAEAFLQPAIQRGIQIEQQLAERFGGGLLRTFPVIDRFFKGVATSVKSLDLAAKTYQNGEALFSRLKGFVDRLAGFQGGRLGGIDIQAPNISSKVLELVVKAQDLTVAQAKAIASAAQYANSQGQNISIHVIVTY